MVSKSLLSEYQIQKCMIWALENIDRGWLHVLFSNEESFWAGLRRTRAWSVRGARFVQLTVKYPVKINTGCAFGYLKLITTSLNAEEMGDLRENMFLILSNSLDILEWYGAIYWKTTLKKLVKSREVVKRFWKTKGIGQGMEWICRRSSIAFSFETT